MTLENFNKVQPLRSYSRNPRAAIRGFHVGGLVMNPRITTFVIVWLITPRGHNYAILTKKNLILVHCIINKVDVKWIHVMKEHGKKQKGWQSTRSHTLSWFLNW